MVSAIYSILSLQADNDILVGEMCVGDVEVFFCVFRFYKSHEKNNARFVLDAANGFHLESIVHNFIKGHSLIFLCKKDGCFNIKSVFFFY